MRRRELAIAVAGLTGVFLATGAFAQNACPTPSSTFDVIQRGIFDQHSCSVDYCHGESMQAGLDLRAGHSYESLMRETTPEVAHEHEHGEDELVDPGEPEDSVLWKKLAAKTLGLRGVPGKGMPLSALPISTGELEGIRLWILAGAPETGTVAGVSDLINPCPPPPQDENGPLPPCDPSDQTLLLPDLSVDPPQDVRVIYDRGHRVVTFSTAVANMGDGPLIVQASTPTTQPGQTVDALQVILRQDGTKCVHTAGVMRRSDDGTRWAYGNTVEFELRKDDPVTGAVVAHSSKTAYCLLDTDPVRASLNLPHQFQAHCTDSIGRMGISSGYKDVYYRIAPGQWIDLDGNSNAAVDPGTYYLLNIVNPNDLLWETNESFAQNMSYTRVRVRFPDPNSPRSDPPPVPGDPPPVPGDPPPARAPHHPHDPQGPHPSGAHQPHQPHQPTAPVAHNTRLAHRPQHAPQRPLLPHHPQRQASR